jgi:hypothetical protein
VTTSDNFLGMSGKDPSSSCCEELLVVLHLPHAKSAAGVCYHLLSTVWSLSVYGSDKRAATSPSIIQSRLILRARPQHLAGTAQHMLRWNLLVLQKARLID